VITIPATAQKDQKAWTKWSEKEAEKMLNDSPWAQVQTDTDTSEMFYSPTAKGGAGENGARRTIEGAVNTEVPIKFFVRFFSARPIRSALARLIELQKKPDQSVIDKLHAFAELKSSDSIILTVSFETSDQRYGGIVMQTMNSAVTATLKNETYLEREGKRLFLEEYVPPGRDGFGARFIFLRNVDGQPFINASTKEARFRTKYSNGLRVERVFKVEKMMYNGELEY
jgi:hypothetical protein